MAKNDHEKSLEVLRAEMAMIQGLIEAKEAEELEKKRQEEEAKKAELERSKEIRRKAIQEKEEELAELIANFIKDYGHYESSVHDSNYGGILPYLWHLFL